MTIEGQFIMNESYSNSIANNDYFGVQFLRYAGYWDKNHRFWTDQKFPNNTITCCKIKKNIQPHAAHNHNMKEIHTYLQLTCPAY